MTTGLAEVPHGVDPGDFVVSCSTLKAAVRPRRRYRPLAILIDDYLANQAHKTPSSVYTEEMHPRNLAGKLGGRVQVPADRIARRDLELFLQARLKERSPSTVDKERTTVIHLFRWALAQGDLESSSAVDLPVIKGDVDLPPFRTAAEIKAMIARGGLDPDSILRPGIAFTRTRRKSPGCSGPSASGPTRTSVICCTRSPLTRGCAGARCSVSAGFQ